MVYGVSKLLLPVLSLNASIYAVPIVLDKILTTASDTATGNHNRKPLLKMALAMTVLVELRKNGIPITLEEIKMKAE